MFCIALHSIFAYGVIYR